jgi:hypothetical protein
MGNNKPVNNFGDQSSNNGHELFYDSTTYRNSLVNQRPKRLITKGTVIFFSLDIAAITISFIGILHLLSDIKIALLLLASFCYLVGRAVIIWGKVFAFWGKHSESIRKGWKSFKEMFNE